MFQGLIGGGDQTLERQLYIPKRKVLGKGAQSLIKAPQGQHRQGEFKSIIPLIDQGFGKQVAFMCCWWECKLTQPSGGQFDSTHQKP